MLNLGTRFALSRWQWQGYIENGVFLREYKESLHFHKQQINFSNLREIKWLHLYLKEFKFKISGENQWVAFNQNTKYEYPKVILCLPFSTMLMFQKFYIFNKICFINCHLHGIMNIYENDQMDFTVTILLLQRHLLLQKEVFPPNNVYWY